MSAPVRQQLRRGVAQADVDVRHPGEADEDLVQRLAVHPLYFDATDAEMSQACGVPVGRVRAARRELDRSHALRGMAAHARAVAQQTGWTGRPRDLVTVALEEYAQRAGLREAQRVRRAAERAAESLACAEVAPRPEERPSEAHRGGNPGSGRAGVPSNASGAPRARGDVGREASGLRMATGDGTTGRPAA